MLSIDTPGKCKFCGKEYDQKKNDDWILNSEYCSIQCNLWFIEFGKIRTVFDLYEFRRVICEREVKELDALLGAE